MLDPLYRDQIVGTAPAFPARMEERITASLVPPSPPPATDVDGDAVADVLARGLGARYLVPIGC